MRVLVTALVLTAICRVPLRAEALPLSATTPVIATSNPEYTNRSGRQNPLGVISTESGFLVLWADAGAAFSTDRKIYVSRVDDAGRLVDPTGIPIAVTNAWSAVAVKEADGARLYWIEWEESSSSFRIMTTSVSADGVVAPIASAGNLPPQSPGGTLAGASSGSRTLLVFGRYLIVVDGAHLTHLTDLGGWGDPATVAIAGDRALVTWTAAGGVLMYQIVSLDGEILDAPGGSGLATGVSAASSASNGTSILLAYSTSQSIVVKRFDLHAASLSDVGAIPAAGQPLVIWNGSRFVVAWLNFNLGSLVGADVTPAGLTTPRVLVRNSGFSNWAAVGENGILFVDQRGFCIRVSCEYDVWYSIVPLDVSVPAETSTLVSAVARRQFADSVAAVGSKYFAIWTEQPGGIYGAVVDRDGPSVPIRIANEPDLTAATVVSAGDRALVLTIGNAGSPEWYLTGTFFDENGNVTGTTTPIVVGGTATDLHAAWSGSVFLATWHHVEEVSGVRIAANGTAIDSYPFVVGTQNNGGSGIATAFDGHDFLVSWMQIPVIGPYAQLLAFARVSPSGTVTPVSPFVLPSYSFDPDLACGGGRCLATWTEVTGDVSAPSEIRGLLIRSSDFDAGSGSFVLESEAATTARVAWNGSAFLTTWIRTNENELRAATVEQGSSPAVSASIRIGTAVDAGASDLACGSSDECLALFGELVDDRIHGESSRLFKSFLGAARPRGVRRPQ